jgi:hypothetical protein
MITISLNGWMLLLFIMILGGWYGWRHGIRSFLTVTLVSALAYMMFVNGMVQVIAYFENLYSNLPKLFAILIGNNPDTVAAWPAPGLNLTLPLAVRIVLFIVLVALAWIFNSKPDWYSNKPNPQGRQLGAFSGALTALIWTSAITTFWREAATAGGGAGPLSGFLGIFPDVSAVAPWLITIFLLIVVISIVLNVPKLWKA